MLSILQALDIVLPLLYAGVFGLYLAQFVKDRDVLFAGRWALYAALGIHGAYFALRSAEFHYFPVGSKPEFLSLVALSIAFVYAVIERQQQQSRTGVFFVAISLVLQSFAAVFMTYSEKHELLLENPTYAIHVVILIFGLTALAVGALYALMYAMLSRKLKTRDLGMIFKRLPPLATLERMSKIGTVAGAVLLGFGLGLGYLVATTVPDFDFMNLKIIIADVIWLGYVGGILYAKFRGISGLKTAYLSMVWFAVFLTSIAVANHQFQ